ncbi:MAG: aminopeptidase [Cereibacter sphaeroides]|uniref:Aminopeptidase n=1 Tax=Cereibacter sphaeroides TaxID=1063 RepID=A0A2W5SMY8_CERSP|nr:MAG: aminopeptidase [Cereibacter sphaeroides]
MNPLRIGKTEVDLPALGLSLTLGLVGGLIAIWLHLPLGMLLGSLLAVATAAILEWRPSGVGVGVPTQLRNFFVPVIGLSIGGAFTPQILREAAYWWPSLLALLVYIPLTLGCGYLIYHRLGHVPKVTAFFGAVPGGLIETVTLGEAAGAEPKLLTLLQFLRLILCIIFVPIGFTWMTGHAVGSASGVQMTGSAVPLGLWDVSVLLVAGVAGAWLGKLLRLPAGIVTGPLLLSGIAHLTGLTQTVPPGWMVTLTQLVVGASLGARFAGLPHRTLWLALRLAILNSVASLALAVVFALVLARVVAEPVQAVFLAYAPGGIAEMSLIALSLQISVVYVSAHHVARIVLSVLIAQLLSGRLRSRRDEDGR